MACSVAPSPLSEACQCSVILALVWASLSIVSLLGSGGCARRRAPEQPGGLRSSRAGSGAAGRGRLLGGAGCLAGPAAWRALPGVARDMRLAVGWVDRGPGPDLKWVHPRVVGLGSRQGHVFPQVAHG